MMGIEFDRSRMQNIQIMLFGRQCATSSSAYGIVIVQLKLLNGGVTQSNKADKRSQHFAVTALIYVLCLKLSSHNNTAQLKPKALRVFLKGLLKYGKFILS